MFKNLDGSTKKYETFKNKIEAIKHRYNMRAHAVLDTVRNTERIKSCSSINL